MKVTKEKFEAVVSAIVSRREDLFAPGLVDQIWDNIYWAWENWGADVLATYYTGEKPAKPGEEFMKQWVRNELTAVPENYAGLFESFKN